MEWASGGSLTSYVADKWQNASPNGLVLSEDEARYFFKVTAHVALTGHVHMHIELVCMRWHAATSGQKSLNVTCKYPHKNCLLLVLRI